MKKTEQAGTACQLTPGMTSITGNNVLNRTKINTPLNEAEIRGVDKRTLHKITLPYVRSTFSLMGRAEEFEQALEEGYFRVI